MRWISKVVVHCSDTPDTRDVDIAEIRRWHVKERGFSDVGYHYAVKRDGTLEKGRPEYQIGAHVQGHNLDSIGICLVGRTLFSPEQLATLKKLLNDLLSRYHLSKTQVLAHNELDPHKTCPNMTGAELRALL